MISANFPAKKTENILYCDVNNDPLFADLYTLNHF